eukprot:c36711_g1_i1 orf=2-439(-)
MDLSVRAVHRAPTSMILVSWVFMSAGFFLSCAVAGYGERFVFCEYLLSNPLYTDDIEGFTQEIILAQSYGIDAFSLNTKTWAVEDQYRASQIYAAAKQLGTGFKLFFTPNWDTGTNITAQDVVEMLTSYSSHPNQFTNQGKQFLSS